MWCVHVQLAVASSTVPIQNMEQRGHISDSAQTTIDTILSMLDAISSLEQIAPDIVTLGMKTFDFCDQALGEQNALLIPATSETSMQ